MKSTRNLNKSMIATAVAVAFAAPAFAQDANMTRVEITGSSIKRTESEAPGAITIMNRADIDRTGATTALEILRVASATQTSISSETASSGSFATNSSAVGMRSLGKVATLVLVNGRRIAQYGLADGAQDNFTNLDAIASEAIERIEILKDGASAIYGSDAIAGVVNIILRKEYVGARLKANYRVADGFKDYRNRNLSAIVGFGELETDGFNTWISVEGYKRDGWTTENLRSHVPDWHAKTPGRSTWDATSAYSPTGNLYRSATNYVAAPGCPPNALEGALCKWNVLPYTGQTTNNKRWALASNTHFKIGKDIDANFEITSAGGTSEYIVAPFQTSGGQLTTQPLYWYNVNAGKMVGPFTYPKLPVGHPNNPDKAPVEFRARLMDTGNGFNFNSTDSEQSRFMLALAGVAGGWDWKSAAGYMTSEANKGTRNISAKGYTDAIVNGTYKFGQQNDIALLESMFPKRSTIGDAEIYFVDGTVTGTAMQLPAGPLNVALGASYRRESYMMSSSKNVLDGELVQVFGLQVKDTYNHSALFAEAEIPVMQRVALNAAVRADKSGNAEAHLSPKLGLRIKAMDSLLLRATASGGFRAPNIVESGNGLGRSAINNSTNDPRRCGIASQLSDLVQKAPGATTADKQQANTFKNNDCLGSVPNFATSNPDLKPETSRSFTGGLVWEPVKNHTVTLDYFHIERKDQISQRGVVDILKGEASLPAGQLIRVDNTPSDNEFLALVAKYVPGNKINFGGVGKVAMIFDPYINTGKTKAEGFDFELASKYKFGTWGDVNVKLDGTYLLTYKTFSDADGEYTQNLAGNWDYGSRLRAKLHGTWRYGKLSNGLIVNYASGYSNNNENSPTYCVTNSVSAENMDACNRVKSNTTVDYNLSYSGIKGLTLSLNVNNLFDKAQPVRWRDGWSFTTPQIRTIGVTAAYEFF